MMKNVYIISAKQISIQQPLVDEWMEHPIWYDSHFVRSIDPDFKQFIAPNEARRMGKILKRSIATSLSVIQSSGIENPDAIITGTGLGCIENTEKFLGNMCRDGESLLTPTSFMQSTHNTIGSLIGIHTHNNGYNATYSHRGVSFEYAMHDAYTQMQLGKISTALVGSHDEVTPCVNRLMDKIGVVGDICGESSVSMMLSTECKKDSDVLCRISGIKILYRPTTRQLQDAVHRLLADAGLKGEDVDAVFIGMNGNVDNDSYYQENKNMFNGIPKIRYKHLFGDSFSASALGTYAASCCIHKGKIPEFMYMGDSVVKNIKPETVVIFNQSDGKNYSIILLESLCGE